MLTVLFALLMSASPGADTETYRQQNATSTTYLDLRRVAGGAEILHIREPSAGDHLEPVGVYFIATTSDGFASRITLTRGPVRPAETLTIINPRPIGFYRSN